MKIVIYYRSERLKVEKSYVGKEIVDMTAKEYEQMRSDSYDSATPKNWWELPEPSKSIGKIKRNAELLKELVEERNETGFVPVLDVIEGYSQIIEQCEKALQKGGHR
jgi:hypothetical protein